MSTATEEQSTTDKVSKILIPGTEIEVSFGKVKVFPMGVRHVKTFNEKIMKAISTAFQYTSLHQGQDAKEIAEQLLAVMMPTVITDLVDIVEACTEMPNGIEFLDMPHYDFAKVAEAWFIDSFGTEDKRNPWIEAVERAIHCFTGKKSSISEMLSKLSSRADTKDKTSSTTDNQPSPTEDGPSPSSSSTSSEPST